MRRLYAWIIDFALVNALLPAAAAEHGKAQLINVNVGIIHIHAMQFVSYTVVPVGWFRFWGRVQPYEKWSRTRIVEGAQLAARVESVTAPQFGPVAR
ncbi:MAG: hypothetical protein ABR591_06565 [Candidatus Velthaea sp.]